MEFIKTTITGQLGRDKKDIIINITITEDIRTRIIIIYTLIVAICTKPKINVLNLTNDE